jgi:thiol-disulfide isomerase/thioredoxin
VDKPTSSNKSLLVSLFAAGVLIASFIGLQRWFTRMDEKYVKYEQYATAPAFNLEMQKLVEPRTLEGKPKVALHDLKGRNILLHFWASWCQPCREEKPMLQELVNQHHDGSLIVIGVASYETEASLQSSGLLPDTPFTVLLDEEGDTALAYKVRAIPQSVLIDGEGRIRYRVQGALTLNELSAIESILLAMKRDEQGKATTAVN